MTVVQVDGGKLDKALEEVDQQYALARRSTTSAAMAGDLQLKGNILARDGQARRGEGRSSSAGSSSSEESTLSQEIKDNAKLFHHYNLARSRWRRRTSRRRRPRPRSSARAPRLRRTRTRRSRSHELDGHDRAGGEGLRQGHRRAAAGEPAEPAEPLPSLQAYQGKGDAAKAKECRQAADFNSLPNQNYAFVRTKAKAGGA